MKIKLIRIYFFSLLMATFSGAFAQEEAHQHHSNQKTVPATEGDYYQIKSIAIPERVVLEVGGLATLPDGRLAVSTRRGEVWMIQNPYDADYKQPYYSRFAYGLHEPLGLAYHNGALYATQRSEITKLTDTNGDGQADEYESVFGWPLSGNYHEYSYGPKFDKDGNMIVTLNLAWIGHGAALSKWRGWTLKVTPDGKMTPIATGMRSPAGYGFNNDGDLFYAENQGDWVGSGRITHVEEGDFVGNPAGLDWSHLPGSPVKLKPIDIPDNGKPMFEVAKSVKGLKPPAVWFPHTLMGISTSDIVTDNSNGKFGPFHGQLFVGDQGHSKIMRVFLEKVEGVQQGAVFAFREGFSSGILRMEWGNDASMFVGMTSRGWASTGPEMYGLQRLVWTGKTPFEIKAIYAKPDGFELEFTQPVDRKTAEDAASYQITGFNYQYHHIYGSPIIDKKEHPIRGIEVSQDGLKARLVVDGLREGYIHEINAAGVKAEKGANSLLHNVGYYTLNRIPAGEKLVVKNKPASSASSKNVKAISQQKETSTKESKETSGQKRITAMPASWTKGPDQTITIGTKPGLKFDLGEIQVKAGSRVKLVFNNNDDMLHNLVVVKPGKAVEVGEKALKLGLEGPEKDYVPSTEDVLFHTKLLQPESSDAIYFTAPAKAGNYTYVCTFPGHYIVMQGTMKVLEK